MPILISFYVKLVLDYNVNHISDDTNLYEIECVSFSFPKLSGKRIN
jgi:hypothetical protein